MSGDATTLGRLLQRSHLCATTREASRANCGEGEGEWVTGASSWSSTRTGRPGARTELILQPLKHDVACAGDAELALELVEARVPALAIVEVELPGLNGLGLLTQLIQRFDGAVPVILTSADRPRRSTGRRDCSSGQTTTS